MRYTREASVKFRATPPAFKLTRKTVTSTVFTEKMLSWTRNAKQQECDKLKCLMVASRACGDIVPSKRQIWRGATNLKTSPERNWIKTDIEPGSLKPESNQIQKVHKLAENQTLRRGIFGPEITQLFNQRLDLWGGAPVIEVESTKDTLSNVWSNLSHFHGCRFQINRQWEVANRTSRLDKAGKSKIETNHRWNNLRFALGCYPGIAWCIHGRRCVGTWTG